MLFFDALSKLHAGLPVHRKIWTQEDGYLIFMPGMKYIWKIVLLPNPNAGNFIFSVEDFEANDWEVFVAPKECIEAKATEAA